MDKSWWEGNKGLNRDKFINTLGRRQEKGMKDEEGQ